jgi:hypothetical protein
MREMGPKIVEFLDSLDWDCLLDLLSDNQSRSKLWLLPEPPEETIND